MSHQPLEILTRMAVEAESLEADRGGDTRPWRYGAGGLRSSAECLSFSRLEQLAAGSVARRSEQAHLGRCVVCGARFRAFSAPSIWAVHSLRLKPVNRWMVQGFGVAAGLALLLVWGSRPLTLRPEHPPHEPKWLRPEVRGASAIAFPWAASCIAGDADCDGFITDQDTDAFFLAVADPEQFREIYRGCEITCGNDIDGDGIVDHRDIAPFIACMYGR